MKGSFQKETKCPNAEHLGRLCADHEMEVLGLDQNISAIELDERRLANERTNFKRSKMRVNRSKEDMVRGRKVKRKNETDATGVSDISGNHTTLSFKAYSSLC